MSLDKFIRLADSLIEFESDLNRKQLPITSVHSLAIHRDELKSVWEDTKLAFEKFIYEKDQEAEEEEVKKKGADVDIASETETVRAKYKSTYITYCRCQTRLGEIQDELSGSIGTIPQGTATSSKANPSATYSGFHLPACDTIVFHGDYLSWPTFRDSFRATFIKSGLSPIQKLLHLRQKTRGEALDIVSKAPLEDAGFALAWKSLSQRFENKRILVNGQLRKLFGLKTISAETGPALESLQRDINSCISNLQLYELDIKNWDPILVYICSNRLPESTLTLWEHSLADKTVIPKWEDLDKFLTNRYRTLESVSETRNSIKLPQHDAKSSSKAGNNQRALKTFQAKVLPPKISCPLCPKVPHIIRKCPKFNQMSPEAKYSEIKKLSLCVNCFSKTHSVRNCTSKYNCGKCGKRHHSLLHIEQSNATQLPQFNPNFEHPGTSNRLNPNSVPFRTAQNSQIQSTSPSSSVVQTCFSTSIRGVLLGTAMVQICHLGSKFDVRALIDSGSEGTFISERMFNMLKLPFKTTNAQISGLNNCVSAKAQKECSFILSSPRNEEIEIPVTALVIPQLAGNLPSKSVAKSIIDKLPSMDLADPHFYQSSKIDILLGGNLFPSIMLGGQKNNVCGSLLAQKTVFGWILTGPIADSSSNSPHLPSTTISFHCEVSLSEEISRFWLIESLPRKNFLSISDKKCEELYSKTTKRNEEGRYIVSLPFKDGFPESLTLGHSRASAMAQFIRNEARLTRTPEFKREYDQVLNEYIQLGHMSEIHPQSGGNNPKHYYLPHHAVIKPESTTTKVRVVFNASSPSANGLSLNDILHTGPVLQTDLTLLLHKWRFYKYVFNADIQKMYRQILVDPDHCRFQRILFRTDPMDQIHEYQLNTVTFGFNCAPYLAIRTMIQLAKDSERKFPAASNILRNNMYVDDVLAGSHSIQLANKAKNELISAIESAGFALRKWTSNKKEILADLSPEHLLREDFLEFDCNSTAKTLGIRWNALTDTFYFVTTPFPVKCSYTKREVLSQIAKLFDPAGWLSPCIVLAKMLMQQIWMEGTDWDEVVSSDILRQWQTFQNSYSSINDIRLPRWLGYIPYSNVQFHAFCDASEKAYAGVLYLRIETKESVTIHLVSSKTKVAPVKTLSIPRLELCGAVLLAEMLDSILPRLEVPKYSTYCWTDSTIVRAWLSKPACNWNTFVANRVSTIEQIIDRKHWYHVDSEHNPADLASRGLYPQELVHNDLWWHGPTWLKEQCKNWPHYEPASVEETDIERKPFKCHFTYITEHKDILENFSSFHKAMRVITYIFRFLYHTHPRYRANFHKESKDVSNSEINDTIGRLIVVSQKVTYPKEYKNLFERKHLPAASSLKSLNPFLDPEGILRCCGRLEASPGLTYNERHPIIVPYNCEFARLLVRFVHDVSLHGGNQLVLRLIRTQYWIPKVQNLIKKIIRQCKPCVVYKHRCQKQLMAALPPERTEISRPFTHTGVDFAGPFDIKNYTGRACLITKGYVCVFVCFSTKAIHLEATSDLSTTTFLSAFQRFVSRRGCPRHIHSDNGTNFVGASRQLAREYIQTSQQAVLTNYAHQNIQWEFIAAGSPHLGGLWEAGVKSFKTHFRKVAEPFKYTFEEFSTLLSRIEACLNSRPISPQSREPSDLAALTPGHFLIGGPILAPLDPITTETPISIINRWQRLKVIHKNFCSRWKIEYLKELQKRHKWQSPQPNIKINDLVVVKEENLPPNCWRLGRITKLHTGKDDRVRVVDLVMVKNNKNTNRSCTCQTLSRRNSSVSTPRSHDTPGPYKCRVCRHSHPLKKCGKFLAMNIANRLEAVRKHRYCVNCLAHNHATGSCSSKTRCKHCKKFHHTMLHVNPRLKKELLSNAASSRKPQMIERTVPSSVGKRTAQGPTLSSLVRANELILLPTVCTLIEMPDREKYVARCLLNTGTPHSKIDGSLAEKLRFMRYTLVKETLCPLKLKSVYDESSFLEHTFRVEDIKIITPTESLPPTLKTNYRNLALADSKFYLSDKIDIILGMDVYKKVIIPGDISKPGLPDATNTIFGYSINGSYAT